VRARAAAPLRASVQHDDAVEPVILRLARPDRGERFLERRHERLKLQWAPVSAAHFDLVHMHDARGQIARRLQRQFEIELGFHEEAHMLQDRHRR